MVDLHRSPGAFSLQMTSMRLKSGSGYLFVFAFMNTYVQNPFSNSGRSSVVEITCVNWTVETQRMRIGCEGHRGRKSPECPDSVHITSVKTLCPGEIQSTRVWFFKRSLGRCGRPSGPTGSSAFNRHTIQSEKQKIHIFAFFHFHQVSWLLEDPSPQEAPLVSDSSEGLCAACLEGLLVVLSLTSATSACI
jgi:hypothetical protein